MASDISSPDTKIKLTSFCGHVKLLETEGDRRCLQLTLHGRHGAHVQLTRSEVSSLSATLAKWLQDTSQ